MLAHTREQCIRSIRFNVVGVVSNSSHCHRWNCQESLLLLLACDVHPHPHHEAKGQRKSDGFRASDRPLPSGTTTAPAAFSIAAAAWCGDPACGRRPGHRRGVLDPVVQRWHIDGRWRSVRVHADDNERRSVHPEHVRLGWRRLERQLVGRIRPVVHARALYERSDSDVHGRHGDVAAAGGAAGAAFVPGVVLPILFNPGLLQSVQQHAVSVRLERGLHLR